MVDLLSNVRLVDVLDVALLAAFLYVLINWLRESATTATFRRALVVFSVVGAAYALAYRFGLFLVQSLVETLFIALLVIAVVVFQSDIRRLIDRLGSWLLVRQVPTTDTEGVKPTDVVKDAVLEMAEMHRGALIVIRGDEPLDRYVTKGIELGGRVSQPLLVSLFNPGSPGHDGAVVLHGEHLVRFATHLPLPARLREVSRYGGTRHAAAVGITEVSDAMVVVVSEENGTVSLAQEGRLEPVTSEDELDVRLAAYWDAHYGERAEGRRPGRHRQAQAVLLAIAIAVASWMTFARPSGETVIRTFTVPVVLQDVPADWSVDDPEPIDVLVTLSSSQSGLRSLDRDVLAITLDASDLEEGSNEFAISEENLQLPPQMTLYDVRPRVVTVDAQPMVQEQLPVEVRMSGVLPDSLMLVLQPDSVSLLFPRGSPLPRAVRTERVDLGDVAPGTVLTPTLVIPDEARLPEDREARIDVRIEARPVATPVED